MDSTSEYLLWRKSYKSWVLISSEVPKVDNHLNTNYASFIIGIKIEMGARRKTLSINHHFAG